MNVKMALSNGIFFSRDDHFVSLHSFPPPNVASGSFVADIDLGFGHEWEASREELMVFSSVMHRYGVRRN